MSNKCIEHLFDSRKSLTSKPHWQPCKVKALKTTSKLSVSLESFNLERDLKNIFRSIEQSCITKYSFSFISISFELSSLSPAFQKSSRTSNVELNCNTTLHKIVNYQQNANNLGWEFSNFRWSLFFSAVLK